MRPSSIVSSVGFKSAIYPLLIFIFVLTFIIGPSIFYLVKSAMFEELKSQVLEEVVLFKVIHNTGGRTALLDSMARLEYQQERVSHTSRAGLFSKDGAKLGGDWELAPDFVGWRNRIFIGDSSKHKGNYLAYTSKVGETNLVVGRNVESINTILTKLIWVLVFAGIVVSVLSLLLAYFANRSVSLKLNRISQTLDKFAEGNTKARLSVGRSNDQIDRISVQVNTYLDRLSILINSIRNTATAIAHDLRTPLNRAFLKLQEAKSFDGDGKNYMQLIERAELELLNVGDIFDTMLRISTIEATHDQTKFEEISCDQLLSEIAETYIPVAEESLQRLIYSPCDTKSLMLYADERMLQQMLSNLIENAIVHCPHDTQITLSCSPTPDSNVCIQVSDNGPGIAKENRGQALSPFGRLDPSRNVTGTGLGLALVKAIVTRHNATLELLDNDPGLRVSIEFPVITTH